jgi:organic radical activating enzyme
MVNLLLTNLCNRACHYCCLSGWVTRNKETAQYLSLKDLDEIIRWLWNIKVNKVQLMGGEPMLHPHLLEIVAKLTKNNIQVLQILTNGLGSTELYQKIDNMTKTKWLVNVDQPRSYSEQEWILLNRNLEQLSWKNTEKLVGKNRFDVKSISLTLSITFFEPDQDFRYIIDLAKKYNCRQIRCDPSRPSSDKSNKYIEFKDLVKLKPVLLGFIRECILEGIKPMIDCAIPPCILTTSEMRFLGLFADLKTRCRFPIDVMPNLNVESCASMRGFIPAYRINSMTFEEIIKKQTSSALEYAAIIPLRCENCDNFRTRQCLGYCLRLKADLKKVSSPNTPSPKSGPKRGEYIDYAAELVERKIKFRSENVPADQSEERKHLV